MRRVVYGVAIALGMAFMVSRVIEVPIAVSKRIGFAIGLLPCFAFPVLAKRGGWIGARFQFVALVTATLVLVEYELYPEGNHPWHWVLWPPFILVNLIIRYRGIRLGSGW